MTMRNDDLASSYVAITKSDSTFVDLVGLYVGGTGDVAIQGEDGNTVTFSACPVGTKINGRITRVMSTNTTATLMVGFKA